ncbi:phosphonate ABC transporter, permease protein PhnE [Facklamia sp. DSM 111018]|uniref:Phosphonate ABC transporter, permease protein PhnE n=2 Tax=Facklamia lactis TaxID=2749967 RepID=A0ABS0LSN5_9LACT|nr:phosphonate ABC transporter, permease protein PhnE [Facklamia lactis]MBG9986972.1 phosphonate ABC transporter, permease protein PhnE [Facklamia lactis]
MFKRETYTINGQVLTEPRSYQLLISLCSIILTGLALKVTDFEFELLMKNGSKFFTILTSMFPPNWEFMDNIRKAIIETIQMSVIGSFLGALVSIPFSVWAASNITHQPFINAFFKLILSIFRTLPTMVIALIATFIFDIGATAGTVAVFLFSLSYVGKLMYEHIENIEMGPFEAMESMGMTRVEAFRFAVVPQLLPTFLSISLFNFEGNIRYSAVLGYVGAGGIGQLINTHISWRNYPAVGMILFTLMLVVFIIEQMSQHFRKRLT